MMTSRTSAIRRFLQHNTQFNKLANALPNFSTKGTQELRMINSSPLAIIQ